MEKVTLKFHEFYALEAELNGVSNTQTGEVVVKGLLHEKLKLVTKYWLNDLVKKVSEVKKDCEKLKEELVKKYGTEDEKGNYTIPMYVNTTKDEDGNILSGDPNPTFLEFQNDFNALLQETRELEYKEFSIDILDKIESDANYPIFFSLLKTEA
jgi:hypothetical protein